MASREDLQTILADIKNQIASFDQKSGILLSAVGIVYALLLDFSLVFSNEWFVESDSQAKLASLSFFFLMMGFGLISIVFFVLSIAPRRREKDAEKHPNYYLDIAKMSHEEFDCALNDYGNSDELLKKQIIANAKICARKHVCIIAGIVALIPYALSVVGLIISILMVI